MILVLKSIKLFVSTMTFILKSVYGARLQIHWWTIAECCYYSWHLYKCTQHMFGVMIWCYHSNTPAHLCIPVALFPADSSPHCRFHIMMNLGRTMVIMSSRVCMVMNLTVTWIEFSALTLPSNISRGTCITLCYPSTLCRLGEQSCAVSTDEGLLCQQLDWNWDQDPAR